MPFFGYLRIPILEPSVDCLPWHPQRLGDDSLGPINVKAAVLRRHLTDDQRGMMAAMWMKANLQSPPGKATEGVPPRE